MRSFASSLGGLVVTNNYQRANLRLREGDVQFVRREVFDEEIDIAVFYYSPQTTADLSLTACKQILWVMHAAEREIIHLPRPRHRKVNEPAQAHEQQTSFDADTHR